MYGRSRNSSVEESPIVAGGIGSPKKKTFHWPPLKDDAGAASEQMKSIPSLNNDFKSDKEVLSEKEDMVEYDESSSSSDEIEEVEEEIVVNGEYEEVEDDDDDDDDDDGDEEESTEYYEEEEVIEYIENESDNAEKILPSLKISDSSTNRPTHIAIKSRNDSDSDSAEEGSDESDSEDGNSSVEEDDSNSADSDTGAGKGATKSNDETSDAEEDSLEGIPEAPRANIQSTSMRPTIVRGKSCEKPEAFGAERPTYRGGKKSADNRDEEDEQKKDINVVEAPRKEEKVPETRREQEVVLKDDPPPRKLWKKPESKAKSQTTNEGAIDSPSQNAPKRVWKKPEAEKPHVDQKTLPEYAKRPAVVRGYSTEEMEDDDGDEAAVENSGKEKRKGKKDAGRRQQLPHKYVRPPPEDDEDAAKKIEWEKPDWAKGGVKLRGTNKGEKLKSGQDIVRPIGGIKPVD